MSAVSATAVSSLRKRTGVSILECKKALEEAGGDEEKAIEFLRKRGMAQAAKKAERDQSEGLIFAAEGDGSVAIVFLKCETDFVARDENFKALGQEIAQTLLSAGADAAAKLAEEKIPAAVQKLGENISLGEMQRVEAGTLGTYIHSNGKIGVVVGLTGGSSEIAKDVAMHAAAMNPLYVRPEDVSAEAVEAEKAIWKEQLAKEGKPEQIMEKIMLGKEKKFREENALIAQEFVKDPSKTIEQYLEGAAIEAYVRVAVG
ncbi:translation elongation factor Ts [Candidatus Peregrinibacteria bacterium CG10_big_fil_rev_8_21_14_0_10_49_10]|nr:MAG: translation elongation factor Ts [Candidatus Peregrinibacteria bacterium CG10_big_fil_rev_8_21_14_0_10_49_10]